MADHGQKITVLKSLTTVFLEGLPAIHRAGLSTVRFTRRLSGGLANLILHYSY